MVEYNNQTILDNLVESVSWSGDIKQASRRADIVLYNTKDGETSLISFAEGNEVRLLDDDGTELFRGVIFYQNLSSDGTVTLTAWDENIYLTKNSDTRKFVNTKASDIIKRLCTDYDIQIGSISDTGYIIPKMIMREKTLWEMMIMALTETKKQVGKQFYIYSAEGKLNVAERKDQLSMLVIDRDTNLVRATYYRSIEDLKNRVKVIAGSADGAASVIKSDQELIDKYGLMQYVETMDDDASTSAMSQRANELLTQLGVIDDESTVEAIGDTSIRAGSSVYVVEPITGIVGAYYVSTDTHEFQSGTHKMYLTLTATDDLPTLEYVETSNY